MDCVSCNSARTTVLDTRRRVGWIRRRRKCRDCGDVFTTVEECRETGSRAAEHELLPMLLDQITNMQHEVLSFKKQVRRLLEQIQEREGETL